MPDTSITPSHTAQRREAPAGLDRHAWAWSILIGAAFTAGAMAYSFWLAGVLHGSPGPWWQPLDLWAVVDGGRFVWSGALGYVYQGSSSYALPLSFVVMAPVSGLVDHLGLVEGAPLPIPRPSAWLVVGPYSCLLGTFLLHAVRRLAWDLGMRSRLWFPQVATVVVVLAPAFWWGHVEDVLALAAAVHAVRRMMRGDFGRACLYLSIAISFKQWAAMLVPLAVFAAPAGRRLRCLLGACALPGALTLFVAGVDWPDASKALFAEVNMVSGFQGHAAVYATWLGTMTSAVSRSLGVLAAAWLGWRFRSVSRAPAILAAASAILLVRPFAEAISYTYYWSPGLLLAGMVGVAVHRRPRLQDWMWPLLAVAWALPRSDPATSAWWWAGELILLGATAWQVVRNLGALPALRGPVGDLVKAGNGEPIPTGMAARPAGDMSWTR